MRFGRTTIGLLGVLWCAGIAACIVFLRSDPNYRLRHPAVTASAAITVAWMLLGWLGMVLGLAIARAAWTLGWLMLLAHTAIAFGVAHGWSHVAAVEHVREVGGTGAGIVVNYLFAAVWGADVAWWWYDPAGRSSRPRWVAVAVHGFLLFIVLNATVVFGPPGRRWAYAACLAALAVTWCISGRPGARKRERGR